MKISNEVKFAREMRDIINEELYQYNAEYYTETFFKLDNYEETKAISFRKRTHLYNVVIIESMQTSGKIYMEIDDGVIYVYRCDNDNKWYNNVRLFDLSAYRTKTRFYLMLGSKLSDMIK